MSWWEGLGSKNEGLEGLGSKNEENIKPLLKHTQS